MTARILDGKALAADVRAEVAQRVAALRARGLQPALAVILVGDNPASQTYVRHKGSDCESVGMRFVLDRFAADLPQAALLARIAQLNADPSIHGILVQLPLPRHIDPNLVIAAISPSKDADGFHVQSAGALMVGLPGFRPCTPYGCMRLLQAAGIAPRGRHAVVVGRSNIVGKPMALMLLQADATVTVCHSATPDLATFTRQADILVAAVGRRRTITADMVKPGAVVIDVGMNQDEAGRLCGDTDFAAVREVAGWITPVPGGVGPMTRAMLLVNTVEAAERSAR
ncbi:MAG TPA: bifunctional methylenetetrahydrofolate dehydrogenase/methenyltetrahydrofolate cyclohydrolase FolD [Rubrivivax sp.]|nr:bifunctional methylenetetrahydrofolate dehydrogenase/methenyltetrahydrofolate cyclohydrolase FolD [Rubrivivax sp.]HRY88734.1 bifunctional methylenetetrahydrofolate dehydrogenase/methenyltetrahydrofolate cyclohydrolase FolD [Rubrivivax sp.]HRZ60799.1 bifunctional methylenetetrahydrofolate dehydrogenase/methenyltetrahydrofolate cyclohydrolase FolD [Rubrivivax sp.]